MVTLDEQHLKAIELMVDGDKNYKTIAQELGIAHQTLRKWRMQPEFIKELASRRREAMSEAQAKLMAKADHAANRLIEMMDDPKANRINFQAAKVILEMALASGFIEFEERLQSLEDALAERQV